MKLLSCLILSAFSFLSFFREKTFDVAPDKPDALIAVRDQVRAWRAAGHSNDAATVRLKRGEYTLTQPLVLDAQDANTTWKARDPEDTVISGGVRIEAKWEDCGNGVFKTSIKNPASGIGRF